MEMRELTRAEEQIMQVLWANGPSFVRDILSVLPEPRPAYSTVSTVVRILESKGFADHETFGPTHRYFAKVSREEYSHFTLRKLLDNYFDGSLKKMVSFFSKREDLDLKHLDEIMVMLEKLKKESDG